MNPAFTCVALAASILVTALAWTVAGLLDRAETAPASRYLVWSVAFWLPTLTLLAMVTRLFHGAALRLGVPASHAVGHMRVVETPAGPAWTLAPGLAAWGLLAVAMGGAIVALGRLALRLAALWRLARGGGAPSAGLERTLRAGAGLPRRVRIVLSAAAPSAIIVGVLRPTLVLPVAYGEPDQVAAASLVCRHEAAHIRRGDNLRLLVEALALAAFWFNPLLRLIHAPLSAAREEVCDAVAVGGLDRQSRQLYARTLVDALERGATPFPAVGLIGHGRKHAALRLSAILSPRRQRRRPLLAAGVTGVMLALGATAVAAAQGAGGGSTVSKVGVKEEITISADHVEVQKQSGAALWVGNPRIQGKVDPHTELLFDGRVLPTPTALEAIPQDRLQQIRVVDAKHNGGRLRIELISKP